MTRSTSTYARTLPTALLVLLVAAAAATGCGGETSYEITDIREVPPPPARTPEAVKPEWTYTLPDGWKAAAKRPMVTLAFQVAGREDTECTFSVLPGGGGGIPANVNRWEKQMGLEASSEEAIAAMPRRGWLEMPAILLDLEGTYGGMRGDQKVEKARMLGLMLDIPNMAVFLKMTGPGEVVNAERAHFLELAESLRPPARPKQPAPSTSQMPPGHPPMPGTAPAGMPGTGMPGTGMPGTGPGASAPSRPSAPSTLTWKAPEGWTKGPPRQMREVTFHPGGSEKTQAYVAILGGTGGGVKANLDRWRQQMGQSALTDEEFAALPRIESLGTKGVLLEVAGKFGGGMGTSDIDQAAMLGFVVERESEAVFVKMLGPSTEVLAQREAFEAFCRSLSDR